MPILGWKEDRMKILNDSHSEEVSSRMRKIKSKDTKLEQKFEIILKEMNLAYSRHPPLFGNPDFGIKDTKVLIFCDSSFWHGRNKKDLSGESFKQNKIYWTEKLKKNKERDEITTEILNGMGWKVVRLWDTDIYKDQKKVKEILWSAMNEAL